MKSRKSALIWIIAEVGHTDLKTEFTAIYDEKMSEAEIDVCLERLCVCMREDGLGDADVVGLIESPGAGLSDQVEIIDAPEYNLETSEGHHMQLYKISCAAVKEWMTT